MPDNNFDELRAALGAPEITPLPWSSKPYVWFTYMPNFRLLCAAVDNAGPILAALDQARAERDERKLVASRAQEALCYVLNGLPATDAVWAAYGNADSARAWLAARDARMKREGAAEWLEGWIEIAASEVRVSKEWMQEQAAKLRNGGD